MKGETKKQKQKNAHLFIDWLGLIIKPINH